MDYRRIAKRLREIADNGTSPATADDLRWIADSIDADLDAENVHMTDADRAHWAGVNALAAERNN